MSVSTTILARFARICADENLDIGIADIANVTEDCFDDTEVVVFWLKNGECVVVDAEV